MFVHSSVVKTCARKSSRAKGISIAGLAGLAYFGASVNQASAQADPAAITANIVNSAVQSAIQDARDRIYRNERSGGHPLGFAGDAEFDSAFPALQYGPGDKRPVYLKAPPAPAPSSTITAVWGTGTFDYEYTTGRIPPNGGVDIGSDSRAYGGIGGADWTFTNIGPNNAVGLLGVLAGDTFVLNTAKIGTTTRVSAPTVGTYGAYVVGGFSADASFTASWIGSDAFMPGILGGPGTTTTTHQTSYTASGNITYRWNMPANVWIEATSGISVTEGVFDSTAHAMGIQDSQVVRLQSGARLGTDYKWSGVTVEPSLLFMLYEDVSVRGGSAALPPGVPGGGGGVGGATDQGELWAKAVLKYNFIWTDHFSSYIQGEIHGTDAAVGNTFHATAGTINNTGVVGTAGFRVTF